MNIQYQEIKDYLLEFFNNDPQKVELWWNTKNPNLGGNTPKSLWECGRGHKVLEFIKSSIEEN